ncbi:hypothetical protein [Streptomyces sp. RK62]|uniref:hypothetical protein n=1 Tax=Streptomyces sp. RK62 TaxID=2824893 RepID=UPI001B35EE36|nr:hypothetical protein [Streptomyces sp. RK62]MBQ0995877.1 hypothetical protein [Streptomyces sp. RK62]
MDRVPEGPKRDLLIELHKLYQLADAPGLRGLSAEIADRLLLSATMNRDLLSKIFSGKRWPTIKQVDSLVRVLAEKSIRKTDIDAEAERFHQLWMSAEQPFLTEGGSAAENRMNAALNNSASSGDVGHLLEYALSQTPEGVRELLDTLQNRGWVRFAEGVVVGLAQLVTAAKVPALLVMLPSSYEPIGDLNFLRHFGRLRTVADVTESLLLLFHAGAQDPAAQLIHEVEESRSSSEVADIYIGIVSAGYDWRVGSGFGRMAGRWNESPDMTIELIREFRNRGYQEGVKRVISEYENFSPGKDKLELYRALEAEGLNDEKDLLLQYLARGAGWREACEFVMESSDLPYVSDRVREGFLSCRSDMEVSNFEHHFRYENAKRRLFRDGDSSER